MDKINKNANYCLETLSADVDNLECMTDFVHAVKRKSKSTSETPAKRRRMTKKALADLTNDEDEEIEQPPPKPAKAPKSASAKTFIKDEADEEAEG